MKALEKEKYARNKELLRQQKLVKEAQQAYDKEATQQSWLQKHHWVGHAEATIAGLPRKTRRHVSQTYHFSRSQHSHIYIDFSRTGNAANLRDCPILKIGLRLLGGSRSLRENGQLKQ